MGTGPNSSGYQLLGRLDLTEMTHTARFYIFTKSGYESIKYSELSL